MILLLCSLSSISFRLSAYVFLRVVAAPRVQRVVFTLYSLYLLAFYLSPNPIPVKDEKSPRNESDSLSKRFLTIIFTLPTSVSRLRLASLIINSLLFLAAVDLTAEPYYNHASHVIFTRVGAVYPDAVKIAIRYPHVTDPIHVVWRQARENQTWTVGPSVSLNKDQDWVSTVKLDRLWPSTSYEYTLATSNGSVLPYPSQPIHFKTFPDPRLPHGSNFRFVVSSCMKPNFPYTPLRGNRIKGFDLLANYLWSGTQHESFTVDNKSNELEFNSSESNSSDLSLSRNQSDVVASPLEASPSPVEFMLFLGDFIYADSPWYFGDNKEAYRRLYRRNYQSRSFRKVYERLPIIHIYDDHEILNNFAGQSADIAPFQNAADPFHLYNAQTNYDSPDDEQNYYDFSYGSDAAFFVMDTRRHRSKPEDVDPISRTMLGDKQLATFYNWLSKVNSTTTFKFIVTSVPFTSLWTRDAQVDSWAAYAQEKSAILEAVFTVPNVIFLSGDRHEFAAIEFNNYNTSNHPVLEFSTSPMSMFYIPLFRTLKSTSKETVPRTHQFFTTNEEGVEVVEDFVEDIPKERVIKSLPIGNFKWSAIEVDTRDQDHPVAHVEVHIDGQVQYRHTIDGVPVKKSSSTALGALIPQFKGVLDRMGFTPNKWF